MKGVSVVFIARKGLDLPISGAPDSTISEAAQPNRVALLGHDYIGLRPRMLVGVGDAVRLGQPVFEDRTLDGVVFTAPAAGTVAAVHRGAKRAFQALVIDLGGDDATEFSAYSDTAGNARESVTQLLLESGLWTAFRTRPFSRTPMPG
ncbi:MAG: NADH:ubiquinone reductase (Na(+)-transporting) subunit A, partial [Myxococcota bacterium]